MKKPMLKESFKNYKKSINQEDIFILSENKREEAKVKQNSILNQNINSSKF